jgi:hypothetical protein
MSKVQLYTINLNEKTKVIAEPPKIIQNPEEQKEV